MHDSFNLRQRTCFPGNRDQPCMQPCSSPRSAHACCACSECTACRTAQAAPEQDVCSVLSQKRRQLRKWALTSLSALARSAHRRAFSCVSAVTVTCAALAASQSRSHSASRASRACACSLEIQTGGSYAQTPCMGLITCAVRCLLAQSPHACGHLLHMRQRLGMCTAAQAYGAILMPPGGPHACRHLGGNQPHQTCVSTRCICLRHSNISPFLSSIACMHAPSKASK